LIILDLIIKEKRIEFKYKSKIKCIIIRRIRSISDEYQKLNNYYSNKIYSDIVRFIYKAATLFIKD